MQQFDVQLFDTLTRAGHWYRVIKIDQDEFFVKRTDNYGDSIIIQKSDYLAGKTGFKKRDLPPVKTYVDPSLKAADAKEKKMENLQKAEQAASRTIEAIADACKLPEKPVSPTTEEVLADMEKKLEKPETKPVQFEEVDYIDPAWGVAEKPARREYLDRIDRMLDLVVPDCSFEPVFDMAVVLATRMLGKGIRDEVSRNLNRKIKAKDSNPQSLQSQFATVGGCGEGGGG